ncbi:tRNA guanosine(34) transglycosylase Tgt [Candidatus Palauibacter polyketidifaciens]|uniref:tRNA guanosine(34) transglycosylase Tgt n=1 Tax=Candidatus Palauibacter polyketidifaciens TaxID=3056740 RepID=UPI0023963BE4|nr:tRNA guanosine(34) transglycosylase Tgt [Candidatus Palauibacter polyketidifaciens]MDE2719813.1 tRNA guanosine(34) transglycosylase Tgt [Candidatus Palauibacter polyketidifaciens]
MTGPADAATGPPDAAAGPTDAGRFRVEGTSGRARAATLRLSRGTIHTPCFMPVGTLGTVKSLTPGELRDAGVEVLLGNAYHLYLRPGTRVLQELGGLHRFMGWDGPILTDSGGFQVFSLARINRIDDEGVTFRSHLDGSLHRLTPELSMEIQAAIGSDIRMAFDECPPAESSPEAARTAVERTLAWLARCRASHEAHRDAHPDEDGLLFPIVQGASCEDLRLESVERTLAMGEWPGVGIGGLSVGEEKDVTHRVLDAIEPVLPADRPRYLMGVGYPDDVIEAVRRGVDMFDCVAPTRNGRNGTAFTAEGTLNIKGARFASDPAPLDETCDGPCCTDYSRAYLRHLFVSGELLGLRLLSLHNVRFLIRLTSHARAAILRGQYDRWADDWLATYRRGPPSPATEQEGEDGPC